MATSLGLRGWVLNSTQGVFIEAEGPEPALGEFLERLRKEKPRPAFITSLEYKYLDPVGYKSFEIRKSEEAGEPTVLVLPDIATCEECLREVFDPRDRRYLYPFTNCTNCGPRFSIIKALPYDRPNTTMAEFQMCEECLAEYENPEDRRYHAQPNACPRCGPKVWLLGREVADPIAEAARLILAGEIVAVKGLGGFHLFCDAENSEAVARLRELKRRWEKPFAVMFPNIDSVREHAYLSPEEEAALLGPEAPIVLVRRRPESTLAPEVSPENPYVGAFLPYTPLHHILMRRLGKPAVATSGNVTDEPMVYENSEAERTLGRITRHILLNDRPIARRVDDSVLFVFKGTRVFIRRSRGFAPLPIRVPWRLKKVLAVGGFHKNTIAIAIGQDVFVSQHIGDLDNPKALRAFRETVEDFQRLWRFKPELVAADMHPGYPSTRFAEELGLPVVKVQHHHAHLAALLAELGREEGFGASWDGTGWGPDGTVWGGEFLFARLKGYERLARLKPFPLPGGERAIKEVWRAGLSALAEAFGEEALEMPFFRDEPREAVLKLAKNSRFSVLTSSAGRLFDAVSALLGIKKRVSYEGQAAMLLEYAAEPAEGEYEFSLEKNEILEIDWRPTIRGVVRDVLEGKSRGEIAFKFHRTMARVICEVARELGFGEVLVSGGVFQNRLLLELLTEMPVKVLWHQQVPPNDGGLSLGQAVIAGV